MKILPVFYSSREPNNFTWYDENRFAEMFSIEKINRAVIGLGKHLSKIDDLLKEESERLARDAFQKYLRNVEKKLYSA